MKDTGFTAAAALGKMGSPAVPYLVKALNQDDPLTERVLERVRSEMGKHTDNQRIWSLLPQPRIYAWAKINAASALGEIGPGARAAIPALMEIVKSTNESPLQFQSALALSRIPPVSEEAVLAIAPLLKADDYRFRGCIACALGEIGPAARPVIPKLVDALHDDQAGGDVRIPAATALWKLGETNLALASHIETLKKDVPYNRWRAARELGALGPSARQAVPALSEALHDEEETVRGAAQEALGKIDPQALEKTRLNQPNQP